MTSLGAIAEPMPGASFPSVRAVQRAQPTGSSAGATQEPATGSKGDVDAADLTGFLGIVRSLSLIPRTHPAIPNLAPVSEDEPFPGLSCACVFDMAYSDTDSNWTHR